MAQITLTEKEYEKLKDDLEHAISERDQYKQWYHETQPDNLKKRLKENAFMLANLYLKALFKNLGFKTSEYFNPIVMDRCNFIPDNWYLNEKTIKVTLEANITSETKEAFFRIGVITKEEKETDPLEVETSINN